jgi:hypothetical protein
MFACLWRCRSDRSFDADMHLLCSARRAAKPAPCNCPRAGQMPASGTCAVDFCVRSTTVGGSTHRSVGADAHRQRAG